MHNLLNATDIATLFLDGNLNIKRYTDQAQRLIRLIPSDVGRPIGDLVSTLRYAGLVRDAEQVLKTLVYKELEIQSENGNWYLTRMLPYRTADNVIDGLVITFVDITTGKQLRELERGLVDALASSATCVYGQGKDLRFKWVFGSLYGHDKAEVLGKTDAALLPPEEALKVVTLKRRALAARTPQRSQVTLCVAGKTKTFDLHMHVARPQSSEAELICVSTELDALRGLTREVAEPEDRPPEPNETPARPAAKTSSHKKPRTARARGKSHEPR
jgi:two-component system CheB/CheR fusion protein